MPIPDVQSGTDERHLAIDQVGIQGLKLSARVRRPRRRARSRRSRRATSTSRWPRTARARTCRGSVDAARGARAVPARPAAHRGEPARRCSTTWSCASMRPAGASSSAFPFFVRKIGAGVGRGEPARLRGRLDRRADSGHYADDRRGGRARHVAVPRPRRISRTTARTTSARLVTITVRPTRPFSSRNCCASPRKRRRASCTACSSAPTKIRHRARLRQPALRRGPGARRGGAAGCRFALRGFRVEAENFESIHQPQCLRADRARDVSRARRAERAVAPSRLAVRPAVTAPPAARAYMWRPRGPDRATSSHALPPPRFTARFIDARSLRRVRRTRSSLRSREIERRDMRSSFDQLVLLTAVAGTGWSGVPGGDRCGVDCLAPAVEHELRSRR